MLPSPTPFAAHKGMWAVQDSLNLPGVRAVGLPFLPFELTADYLLQKSPFM